MRETPNTQGLRWEGDWRTSLFVLVFFPVLCGLGVWQMQRAEEKQQLSETWAERRAEAPMPLLELDGDANSLAYRKVTLSGSFLPGRDFLLDNRVREGRYGVEVLSTMRLQPSGELVLVNRGWLPADPARRSLPVFDTPAGPQTLVGSVYVPPGEPYRLGEAMSSTDWPRLVAWLDMRSIETALDEPVYPFSIRLQGDSPAGFANHWEVINTTPEKHRGYAVQWFAMAAVLLLFFVWRSTNFSQWLRRREA